MYHFDDYTTEAFRRPAWARWLTRVMLLASSILMITVILSQPKTALQIERSVSRLHDGAGAVTTQPGGE
ncbi:MAG: hypothetical protein CML68_17330 [Rhodobacteraceae bacterium]|nr:hypothetical protein [Paracoccaceae bacterium]